MKIILPIFAIAAVAVLFTLWREEGERAAIPPGAMTSVGAAKPEDEVSLPPVEGAANSTQASLLLSQAIDRLNSYSSVSALLRQRIHLFDTDLIGSGLYQQQGQGRNRRLRLEMRIQLGDEAASQLQVCDGQILWTHQEIANDRRLNRLDLQRLRTAQRQAAQRPPTSVIEELPTGGLPKLLEAIREHFQPLKAEVGHLGDLPAWAIEAEWKPAMLATLTSEQEQRSDARGPIDFSRTPQLPERVMIFLRHDDLFPQQIEFRRRATTDDQKQATGAAFVAVATLEFSDVQLNQTIDSRQFVYRPAESELMATDVTDQFLQSHGLPLIR